MTKKNKALEQLIQDRIRLAKLEEGGSSERPMSLESAAQVEPRVLSFRCLKCDGETRIGAHEAKTFEGTSMRVVTAVCKRCSGKRTFYIVLHPRAS